MPALPWNSEWARAMRAMTDILGLATIVTLYQAGSKIYNLFEKVLVLDEGREIFYGHREKARPFIEQLGFVCDDSPNVADFLTGVTVPTERAIRAGFENRFPTNAEALQSIYDDSEIRRRMHSEHTYPYFRRSCEGHRRIQKSGCSRQA
jgi:ABC-type multidrug transport system ATPase subunit